MRARMQNLFEWLVATLLVAIGVGIVASILELIYPHLHNQSYVVWASAGAALLISLIGALAGRINPVLVLNMVDTKLGLKARLITAYDLFRGESDNPFREIIEREADLIIADTSPKDAYPYSVPKRAGLLSILFVALIMVYLLSLVDVSRSPDPDAVQAGLLLESVGKTLAVRSEEDTAMESQRIAEEMRKLGRMLQRQRMNRAETQERLSELTSRIQEQLEGISRDMLPESGKSADQVDGTGDQSRPDESGQGAPDTTEAVRQLRESLERMGQLTDEEARFLQGMEEAFRDAAVAGEVVMTLVISNACPVPEPT